MTAAASNAPIPYIAFPDRNYPLSWIDDDSHREDVQRLLRHSHKTKTVIYCLCRSRDSERRRLAVRELGPTTDHWYILARYPKSGHEHAPACQWYAPADSASGLSIYEHGVVVERDDGLIAIRLNDSLETMRPRRPSQEDDFSSGGVSVKRPAMTMRGLLDLAWERAGLDTWRPQFAGKRSWYTVRKLLAGAAAQIAIGRTNLSDRLETIVPGANETLKAAIWRAWDEALKDKRGLLLVGDLSKLDEPALGRNFEAILLKAAQGGYGIRLRADAATIAGLRARFARELLGLADGAGRVVALLHVRPRYDEAGGRFGFVVDGAVARVTEHFIPVASGHEARVARLLVEQQRFFRKPLRYDGEGLFPDFELLDTPRIVPMEVFGRSDPAYTARRDEKIKRYTELYESGWWSWDATATTTVPPLPQPEYSRPIAPTPAPARHHTHRST